MKLINQLTIKNMKMQKKRTIVTIMSVVLTSVLIFGIGLLGCTLRESQIKDTKTFIGSYHSSFQNISYQKKDILKNDKNVEAVIASFPVGVFEKEFSYENNNYKTKLLFYKGDASYYEKMTLKEGTKPTKKNEIVVPDYILKNSIYQLKIGNLFSIDGEDYTIVGTFKNLPNAIQNEKDSFPVYGYMEPVDETVTFYVYYKNTKGVLKESVQLALDMGDTCEWSGGTPSCQKLTNNTALLALYGESESFGTMALILLLIILLGFVIGCFGALVIYNAFAISIMEKKKMLGILASIGATPKQRMKSVFFEAILILLIGLPLGFLLSIGGFLLLLQLLNFLLATHYTLSLYPLFIIVPFFIIIVTVLFSAFSPALRASEITPIEAILQSSDITLKKKKIKTNKLVHFLFGIEGDIALKNSKRNKNKYRVTIVSLVISIVLFITFSTFINLGFKMVDDNYNLPEYDISFSIYDKDFDKIEQFKKELEKNKEIKDISFYTNISKIGEIVPREWLDEDFAKIFEKDETISTTKKDTFFFIILLQQPQYEAFKKKIGLNEDRPILLNQVRTPYTLPWDKKEYIYEGKHFKENIDLSLTLCDWEFLQDKNEYEKINCQNIEHLFLTDKKPFGIAPEGMTYNIPYIILSMDQKEQYLSKESNTIFSNSYQIYMNVSSWKKFESSFFEGRNPEEFGFEEIQYRNIAKEVEDAKNQILAIKICLYTIIIFIAMIGITNIVNTINTSMHLRKKEFAMLRSVGMTPHGFQKMIQFESLFLGIKALLYGFIISTGLVFLIFKIINWGTQLQNNKAKTIFYFPLLYFLICAIAVFLIIFIIMNYASKKAKKENIVDILKQDIF